MNNLPMAFRWRGISSSSIAARTAFVDREPPPAVLCLPYEPPQVAPTPVADDAAGLASLHTQLTAAQVRSSKLPEPERKPVKRGAERLLFAVAEEPPTRGDRKRFKYTSAVDAERAARRFVVGRGGTMSIWLHDEKQSPLEVATVLRDSLDRVWTQVNARPGDRAYL